MLWEKRRGYTVEEFALLMGDYDPIWVGTVENAENQDFISENGPCDWEASKKWKLLLVEAIQYGVFQDDEIHLIGLLPDEYGVGNVLSASQASLETWVNTERTSIQREPLARWFKSTGVRLPYFLCTVQDLEEQVATYLNLEESSEPDLPTVFTPPAKRPLTPAAEPALEDRLPHLAEIQRLLDGTHRCQAPELQLALQAWLEVSKEADQEGELRSSGTKKAPGTEIERWLQKEKGYNKENEGQSKLVPRIVAVANWNKKK